MWRKKLLRGNKLEKLSTCLLFCNDFTIKCVCVKTENSFRKDNTWNYTINPENSGDYALLLETVKKDGFEIDTIIHALNYDVENKEVRDLQQLRNTQSRKQSAYCENNQ